MPYDIAKIAKAIGAKETEIKKLVACSNLALFDVLRTEPDRGVRLVVKFYQESCKAEYGENRAFIMAVAGGAHEGITTPLYNAVGDLYPTFSKQDKSKALGAVLEIMDTRNYIEVQNTHTSFIREPSLAADIMAVRGLYWPGMDEGKMWLSRFREFCQLKEEIMTPDGTFSRYKVHSDYIVGYSLLRRDFGGFGEYYVKVANPDFLDRTVRAIVQMRFASALTGKEIDEGGKRLRELLPEELHDRIEPARREMDLTHLIPLLHHDEKLAQLWEGRAKDSDYVMPA